MQQAPAVPPIQTPIVNPVPDMGSVPPTPPTPATPPTEPTGGETPIIEKHEDGGMVGQINWTFVVIVGVGLAAAFASLIMQRRKLKAQSELVLDHRLKINDLSRKVKEMNARQKMASNS